MRIFCLGALRKQLTLLPQRLEKSEYGARSGARTLRTAGLRRLVAFGTKWTKVLSKGGRVSQRAYKINRLTRRFIYYVQRVLYLDTSLYMNTKIIAPIIETRMSPSIPLNRDTFIKSNRYPPNIPPATPRRIFNSGLDSTLITLLATHPAIAPTKIKIIISIQN